MPATTPAPIPGSVLYSIDAADSEVILFVYREGPMAALGHNHVIAAQQISGSVQLHDDLTRSRFELQLPAATLQIDDPVRRQQAGADFSSIVSDGAREGTRSNMLGPKLLDAENFPMLTVRSEGIAAGAEGLQATVRVIVHDREAELQIPMTLMHTDNKLVASGNFSLLQSTLGLTPYSVAMGALRVRDQIDVKFRIAASRVRLP
jgi:polyisoprenoid-binding protein YceI